MRHTQVLLALQTSLEPLLVLPLTSGIAVKLEVLLPLHYVAIEIDLALVVYTEVDT